MTEETWDDICATLTTSIGQGNYTSWIKPLKLSHYEDGIVHINAPTTFFGNYVQQHFYDKILGAMHQHGISAERLILRVQQGNCAAQNTGGSKASKSANTGNTGVQNGRSGSSRHDIANASQHLDKKFTFDQFVVGKPNEMAYAAAKRVADGGPLAFNPLFLYGGVGLGKTHLMHAIAWQMQTMRPDLDILYLSAEQFMYRFVKFLRDRRMMDFKSIFRSVDVLIVDDVQFIAGKDSTQEEFFHTFNALVDQNKQTIISADRPPGEIKGLEERIASRLQSGLVVDIHPTDYELRLSILQSKIEFYRQTYPNVDIHEDVLNFLAQRINTNVRVLEGALTRLFAFASLVGRPVTMDLTQDCLSDILRAFDRKLTVEEIQRRVSDHYNIRLSEMIGPKRVRTYARPRQIAMYLCKHLTTRSLPEIGRRFGGRDHTTVMHGVRKIEELRVHDSQIEDDLEMLRRSLEG